MRQITKDSINAFRNKRKFNRQNMSVFYSKSEDTSYMALHGNTIAIYKHFNGELLISNCGWESVTTKERLNGIIDSMTNGVGRIYQKNWQWYLNGNTWDGKLTVISSDSGYKKVVKEIVKKSDDSLADRYYNIIKNL